MPAFTDYSSYDGLGLADLVKRKEVTPLELVEAAIERIEKANPQINAVIHKLYDRARSQAKGELPHGPFAGVPFILKDLQSALAGEPLESGSRFYKGYKPSQNSELVNRYLAAGVIVVGKASTPEFGLIPTTEPEAFGPTRNPWDMSRTTGGSSGGSAAAVASRMVPLAGGGDGGGSIRIPSSCCGLFGLKPTRGRTPVGPLEAESWHGFAIEHVLTRSVRDSAAMLDAICGPYVGDFHYLPKPERPFLGELTQFTGRFRIAASAKPLLPSKGVHPDCLAAFEETVKLLKELGHEVIEDAPAVDALAFGRAFVSMVGGSTALGVRNAEANTGRKAHRGDFEVQTWLARKLGEALTAGEYLLAVQSIQKMCRDVLHFSENYDLILNPTLSKPPPKLGFLHPQGAQAVVESLAAALPVGSLVKSKALLDDAAAQAFAFVPWTPVYNATGQPSMSVPLHWNKEGLPIGMMFTAKFGQEATLYRLAAQLEQARPWKDKKPPVSG
ncbi:MAG: amidase [Bdellovibrionota bacterium]